MKLCKAMWSVKVAKLNLQHVLASEKLEFKRKEAVYLVSSEKKVKLFNFFCNSFTVLVGQ